MDAHHLDCTHHLPTRSDDELEGVFAAFLTDHAGQYQGLEITLAYEGLDFTLLTPKTFGHPWGWTVEDSGSMPGQGLPSSTV